MDINLDEIVSSKPMVIDQTTKIITTDSSEGRTRFLDKLTPEQQTTIAQKTPEMVDKFIVDQNTLLDFGQPSVEKVNQTVNHILHEQRKMSIPEVDNLLLETNRELNGFVAKYQDVSSPVQLEEKKTFLQKLFKRTKNKMQDFYFASQDIEQKMDIMATQLVKHDSTLIRNIVAAEQLIEENTKSIENLVGVIAFIESFEAESARRADALQNELATIESHLPEYHAKSEQLTRISEVVNNLEQLHAEYLSRLYIAWATTPQMRNLVKVSSDMRHKINLIRRNTIPTMKLSISQIGLLQQSMQSGASADAIVKANNAALQMLAETSKEAIPYLEQSAQQTTLSAQSVEVIAQSLVAQNEGLIKAIQNGRQQRLQLEQTIVRSAEAINNSTKLRDKEIINALLDEAREVEKLVEQNNNDYNDNAKGA